MDIDGAIVRFESVMVISSKTSNSPSAPTLTGMGTVRVSQATTILAVPSSTSQADTTERFATVAHPPATFPTLVIPDPGPHREVASGMAEAAAAWLETLDGAQWAVATGAVPAADDVADADGAAGSTRRRTTAD